MICKQSKEKKIWKKSRSVCKANSLVKVKSSDLGCGIIGYYGAFSFVCCVGIIGYYGAFSFVCCVSCYVRR